MNLNATIAANLKRLRLERHLTLSQLAECSNVSKVMLSQIEKGDSNPTINLIWKIANGLKVPYTQLIDAPEHDAEHVLRDERISQNDLNGHYRVYNYYHSTSRRNFEMFMIELDPGTEHQSVGHSEKSQEYLVVLEGTLHLTTQDQTYKLCQEDALCFSSQVPHCYNNPYNEVVKAVVINYYPL